MARFIIPRDIYYGRGSLAQLRLLEGNRAMLIGGEMTNGSGFLRRAESYLQEAGLAVRTFVCVQGEPTSSQAQAGAKALQEFKPDWIVALGGEGSVSAAKAMWVLYEDPALTLRGLMQWKTPSLRQLARLVVAPAGGGGEGALGGAAYLLDPAQGKRYMLLDPVLTPDIAIIDPDLAAISPPLLLARGGIAALSQALEALIRGALALAQPLALRAASLILCHLPAAVNGEAYAGEALHEAQCMAGLAFANAPTGLGQILSSNTCIAFHTTMPTGIAEAIFLPQVLGWEPGAKEAAAQVCAASGITGEPLQALYNRITSMRDRLGLPATFRAFGIEEAEFLNKLPALSQRIAQDPALPRTARRPSPKEAEGILRKAYYGS